MQYFKKENSVYKIQKDYSFESNIEQVLAATTDKAPTIRPPAFHHENYPS